MIIRIAGFESESCDVRGSPVAVGGVHMVGKYNFCHSNCHFFAFLEQACREQQFLCVNCKKISNIDGENKYLIFVSYHLARAKNG